MTPNTQGLLVIKGSKTGLGDRIRAALVGLLYAEATGRRVYVDWRDGMYGPPGENAFERLLAVQGIATGMPPDAACTDVAPSTWSGRLAKNMDEVYLEDGAPPWDRAKAVETYSIDLGRTDYAEATVVCWEFTQLPRLRPALPPEVAGLSNEQIESWAWHRHLRLAPELLNEVDKLFDGIAGTTVGVHVRATIEFAEQKGSIDLSRYFRVLDRLIKKHAVQKIYVATDNEAVLKAMKDRYPQTFSRPKWFARPGEPLHLVGTCPDNLMMARDALIEMAMLARCDWLISVDNSSYSIMARLMSAAPSARRITLTASKTLWQRILHRARRAWAIGQPART